MDGLEAIVERLITEAVARGEFAGLPGEGRRLRLDDDVGVPEEYRLAFRVLRNAGFVPLEVDLRRQIAMLEELLAGAPSVKARTAASKRLSLLQEKFNASRRYSPSLLLEEQYRHKVLAHLAR